MKRVLICLAALAPMVTVLPSTTAAQAGPVVTVLAFDNSAFGPGAKDFDGIGKGIMDLLITDLASTSKVRVVDRDRIQSILDEQKLTASGAIDGTTAVKVGKLLGACYSIYGSFIRDQKTGTNTITIHTTSNETGQIQNAQKIPSKGDDVMSLIAEASAKFIASMDVKSCGGTSRSASASPAQQGTAPAGTPAASTEKYAKALSPAEVKKLEGTKLDARTMLLYSRGLDAIDHKDSAKARELLTQVATKYPDFSPAKTKLESLKTSGD